MHGRSACECDCRGFGDARCWCSTCSTGNRLCRCGLRRRAHRGGCRGPAPEHPQGLAGSPAPSGRRQGVVPMRQSAAPAAAAAHGVTTCACGPGNQGAVSLKRRACHWPGTLATWTTTRLRCETALYAQAPSSCSDSRLGNHDAPDPHPARSPSAANATPCFHVRRRD